MALRRRLQNLGLLLVSTALALGAAELVVRRVAPQQLVIPLTGVYRTHDVLGWEHVPDLDTRVNTGGGATRVLTDADGHRVGAAGARPAGVRVLALGDSFVEALQVDYELTATHLLEEMLSADLGRAVRVVNTGVGGWQPDHYRLKAAAELRQRRYAAAVVFLYLPNDVVATSVDRFSPKQLDRRRPFRRPGSLRPGELMEALALPLNDQLEMRSQLFILLKNRARLLFVAWGVSKHTIPEAVLTANAGDERWDVTADICAALAAAIAAAGADSLFVLLPGVYQVDREIARSYVRALGLAADSVDMDQPQRELGRRLEARGIAWLDLTPALRRAHAAGRRDLYGRVDTHLAPAGHRLVAEELRPRLRALLAARPTGPSPGGG